MIFPFVKSSFDALLKLQEVTHSSELVTMSADTRTEIPNGEKQAGLRNGAAGSVVLRGGRK